MGIEFDGVAKIRDGIAWPAKVSQQHLSAQAAYLRAALSEGYGASNCLGGRLGAAQAAQRLGIAIEDLRVAGIDGEGEAPIGERRFVVAQRPKGVSP
jgi:hypothetical protein